MILWLLSNWKLISAALVTAALAFLLWSWNARGHEIDDLNDEVRVYKQVITDMRAWHDTTVATLERKADDEKKRGVFETTEAARNQADRAGGDGPIAPVLANGLRALRARQAANKKGNTP